MPNILFTCSAPVEAYVASWIEIFKSLISTPLSAVEAYVASWIEISIRAE